MRRELKKIELVKLYREFSRQKYNKYKHQFPRMKESELVQKIIKEWEGLLISEKVDLYQIYLDQKYITDAQSESSEKRESPGSSKSKKKTIQPKSVTKTPLPSQINTRDGVTDYTGLTCSGQKDSKRRHTLIKVFKKSTSADKQKVQSQSSDFARDAIKKDFEVSDSVSKQVGTLVGFKSPKKKGITKGKLHQPKSDYLKFFKFYYDRLTYQHPRWNASQISTIIKLLWKKKQVSAKLMPKNSLLRHSKVQRIPGRMKFRKAFGYNGFEGALRWKQLPHESKRFWNTYSDSLERKNQIPSSIHFAKSKASRKGSEEITENLLKTSLHFLKKVMI